MQTYNTKLTHQGMVTVIEFDSSKVKMSDIQNFAEEAKTLGYTSDIKPGRVTLIKSASPDLVKAENKFSLIYLAEKHFGDFEMDTHRQ